MINHRRATDAADAYIGLMRWPLTIGHRYRPRQGCTCGIANCATPGAHPLPGTNVPRGRDDLLRRLFESPGAGLIAWTAAFDAVVVPRSVGMFAMVEIDRSVAPVPCILTEDTATLLVLPATGRYAVSAETPGDVRTGMNGWVALPPSHGHRWDTPPWVERTTTPVTLIHGRDIARHLTNATAYATAGTTK